MSCDGRVRLRDILLQTDVSEGVLPEDGLGVEVGGHEATLALERLVGGEALHVGGGQEAVEVAHEVRQRRVDGHLVLPLELRPHGAELGLGAGGGDYVVHDVDVDVVKNNYISVACRSRHVVNNVTKYNSIFCRGHFNVSFDVGKIIGRKNKWLNK